MRPSPVTSATLATIVVTALACPAPAGARAVCVDLDDCGMVDRVEIVPPIGPDLRPPVPRAALRVADVARRLGTISDRVLECVATHADERATPRSVALTIFVDPDGRWSVGFGPRPTAPARGAEARGATPLEVCIANWVSSEIGPRLQPPGGRRVRRVARSYRIPAPVAAPATGAAP